MWEQAFNRLLKDNGIKVIEKPSGKKEYIQVKGNEILTKSELIKILKDFMDEDIVNKVSFDL